MGSVWRFSGITGYSGNCPDGSGASFRRSCISRPLNGPSVRELLSHNDSGPLHLLLERCDSEFPELRKPAPIRVAAVGWTY
jgi:hypothetical protein